MTFFTLAFWTKHFWAGVSLMGILAVLASGLADRKRQRRSRIDDVGFMPWPAITVLSTLIAVVAAALAIKSG